MTYRSQKYPRSSVDLEGASSGPGLFGHPTGLPLVPTSTLPCSPPAPQLFLQLLGQLTIDSLCKTPPTNLPLRAHQRLKMISAKLNNTYSLFCPLTSTLIQALRPLKGVGLHQASLRPERLPTLRANHLIGLELQCADRYSASQAYLAARADDPPELAL
jgi:hypothetical protein